MMYGERILSGREIGKVQGSPEDRFVQLSEIADENFAQCSSLSGADYAGLRRAYVSQLVALASELNTIELKPIEDGFVEDDEWSGFVESVAAARTRLRIRKQMQSDQDLELKRSSKNRIRTEIARLRELVTASDLDDSEKNRLIKKLDDLAHDVDRERLNFGKVLSTLALVATICGGSTSALANAPKAAQTVFNILQVLGDEAEDAAQALPAPPKALPAPPKGSDPSAPSNARKSD